MSNIKIYTTHYCPHCVRAKNLLQTKSADFEEIDLTEKDALREELRQKTDWMTVPMIFMGEEFIGGADELFKLEASGELDKRLAALKDRPAGR